jgi:DNA-directed RNA polymerase specialized sigma24 family protein
MEVLAKSLTHYAYNIIGSYEDAKDIVQDALLKFSLLDKQHIENERLYLIRIVINLAIDHKRKLKSRTNYPGPWLPEPIATDTADNALYKNEILSYFYHGAARKARQQTACSFYFKGSI